MDPEDLREVISAYQKCVAEVVSRFDGFVAKYMGDGVLVYFGYPEAHEDDPERAVRAGLELIGAVSNLKTYTALQTRVGIATGLVVVGDLIGSGSAEEQAVVGKTPNLAARLQGVAVPNMVVIAEGTRKLVGNLFELEELEAKDLKGIAGPTRAWAALRPSSVESRFEALHASGLTDLVGRQEELDLLAAALVKGNGWRRSGRVALRRGWYRQVSTDSSAVRPAGYGAAYAPAVFLFTTTHRQRALSDHQPDGAGRRVCAWRQRSNKARQAGRSAVPELHAVRR